MEPKQLEKGTSPQGPQKAQAAKNKSPFCLRLNALRALSCIAVIITHIVGFHDWDFKIRSLHFGGHMAVFFFFSLSGYLLSMSLVKEIKRRVYENKGQNRSSASSKPAGIEERRLLENQYESTETEDFDGEETINETQLLRNGISSLIRQLQQVQKSELVSILRKYLWNRTWRLFPMYYGCWCVLKFFATDKVATHSLQPDILWRDIFLLNTFPGHLWTMRVEMIFYYTVIPAFICALYTAFTWQKKGLKQVSEVAFASIIGALLYLGVYGMLAGIPMVHPVTQKFNFALNLPPFCFGLIAGLLNYALELKFNARQATRRNEQPAETRDEEPMNPWIRRVKKILEFAFSELNKKRYSIVLFLCGFRIALLNPAFVTMFTEKNEYPNWVLANLNSYWYAIFVLINDSRGGFWKFMRPEGESQQAELRPAIFQKIIYYYGLWSYPIYMIHPISYVYVSRFFPETKYSLEINLLSVAVCLVLGGLCDLAFDKIFVNRIMLGKVVPGLGKLSKALFSKKAIISLPVPAVMAKASS